MNQGFWLNHNKGTRKEPTEEVNQVVKTICNQNISQLQIIWTLLKY